MSTVLSNIRYSFLLVSILYFKIMNPVFLKRSIELAEQSVQNGGGPFGAVIVKDGKIIAEAENSVTKDLDPSAHAEVNAIRKACKILQAHELSQTEIYCSCEPCPMCLSAIYWAHIPKVYFAADRVDAASAGFDDDFIYSEFERPVKNRNISMIQAKTPDRKKPFEAWFEKKDRKDY